MVTASLNEPMLLPEWSRSDAVLLAWFEPCSHTLRLLSCDRWCIRGVVNNGGCTVSEPLRARFALIGIDVDRIRFFEYRTRRFGPAILTWSCGMPPVRFFLTVTIRRISRRCCPDTLVNISALMYIARGFRERGQYYVHGSGLCVTTLISIQQSTTQNLRIRRCTGSMARLHSDSFSRTAQR